MSAKPHQLTPVPENFRHLVPDHGKSPWHPSVKATARVPDPLAPPTDCNCCGGAVEIRHHIDVYGREYNEWPWLYRCSSCGAMVGMHPFTSIPLGTLAGERLRRLRTDCKQPFNLLWQHRGMSRDKAYQLLAEHMGIALTNCHFGLFDEHQCTVARDWSVTQLRRISDYVPPTNEGYAA